MSNQLSGIESNLGGLLNQVRTLRIEIAAKGKTPKPGDVKTPAFYAKLQAIGNVIVSTMRALKSMEHMQGLRVDKLYDSPRDVRYRERQSIDAQLRNIERVRTLASKLAVELRGVYGDAMTPTTADIIEGAQKVFNEVGKVVDRARLHSTAQHVSDGRAFITASPLQRDSALSAVDLLSQAWLLLACVVALTRTRKT